MMACVARPIRQVWAPLLAVALLMSGCQKPGPRALLKGERYLKEQKYDKAMEQLQVAVKLLPNNAQAWNHLGLAYHGLDQAQNAQNAYHNALILNHKLASARFNLGCLLLEQGQYEEAVNELTSYTLLEDKSEAGWLQLGRAQLLGGRLADADGSFRQVLQIVPDHPEALNNLGVLQMKRGRSADAMQFFNRATSVHPDYGPAMLNEAVVQHHYLKNRALALKRYKDYLALDPRPSDWAEVSETVQELERVLHPVPLKPVELALNNTTNATGTSTPPPIKVLPPPKTNAPVRVASTEIHHPPASATETRPDPAPASTREPVPAPTTRTNVTPPAATRGGPTNLPTPPKRTTPTQTPRTTTPTPIATPSPTPTKPAASTTDARPANATSSGGAESRPSRATNTLASAPATASRTASPAEEKPAATGDAAMRMARARTSDTGAASSIPRYQYKNPVPGAPGDRARADLIFREGIRWYRAGRQAIAVERYKEATQLDPTYYEAWINLGVAAYEGADWQTALRAYEMARAIQPDASLAQYNLCLTLQRANYPLDALYELRRFLKEHPNEARGHLALANLYDQVFRNPKLAKPHYQKVLELDSHHPEAQSIRYWLNDKRNP